MPIVAPVKGGQANRAHKRGKFYLQIKYFNETYTEQGTKIRKKTRGKNWPNLPIKKWKSERFALITHLN
jgi:hypothetical protein